MSTNHESDKSPESRTKSDGGQYELKSVRTMRGREAGTVAKWKNEGWELVSQSQGALRTEMTFRRVKPKDPWQQLAAFIAASWAGFRRLTPTTQRVLAAVSGGLVLLIGIGVVVANLGGGGTPEPVASPTEITAASSEPTDEQSQEPEPEPAPEPTVEAYVYSGPHYEIVTVDEDLGPAELDQVWVLTDKFDYSTDAYKGQVKLIISDVVRNHGTDRLYVEVVSDREIAEAEAFSTYEDFVAEHGEDYAINAVPSKEVTEWVASYTGGFDFDTGQASEAASAFEVLWLPYGSTDSEEWRPPAGS